MKRIFVVVALSLLSFRYPGTWVKYTSAKGHFSIEFPGSPTENTVVDTTDNNKIHYATYFPNDSEGYLTDWIDMTKTYPAKKGIKQILEDGRDGAMRSLIATNIITTATNLDKEPYIEFAFTNKEFAGRGRIYLIDKIQYSIITLFSLEAGISPDANKFIKSFRHLQ